MGTATLTQLLSMFGIAVTVNMMVWAALVPLGALVSLVYTLIVAKGYDEA